MGGAAAHHRRQSVHRAQCEEAVARRGLGGDGKGAAEVAAITTPAGGGAGGRRPAGWGGKKFLLRGLPHPPRFARRPPPCRGRCSSPRKPKPLRLRLEARAENLGVERVGKTIAHEGGVIVLDIHVEFLDVGDEEIQDRAVVGELLPRQHHLVWAFLVELKLPCAFLVRIHCSCPESRALAFLIRTDECSLFVLRSQGGLPEALLKSVAS